MDRQNQLVLQTPEVFRGLKLGTVGGAEPASVLGGAARESVAQSHAQERRTEARLHKAGAVPEPPGRGWHGGAAGFLKGAIQRQPGAIAPEGNPRTVGAPWAGGLAENERVDPTGSREKCGDDVTANAGGGLWKGEKLHKMCRRAVGERQDVPLVGGAAPAGDVRWQPRGRAVAVVCSRQRSCTSLFYDLSSGWSAARSVSFRANSRNRLLIPMLRARWRRAESRSPRTAS